MPNHEDVIAVTFCAFLLFFFLLLPFALCLLPYAFCLMPFALCLMPYALCLLQNSCNNSKDNHLSHPSCRTCVITKKVITVFSQVIDILTSTANIAPVKSL
jgi:hypothetical protein